MCFLRDFHVFCASQGPQAIISANGDRNRRPGNWCFSRWSVGHSKLGRRVKRLPDSPRDRFLPTLSKYRRAETQTVFLLPNPTRLDAHSPCRWGSPEFIGLGFVSFVSIILTEIFGSPFLKNISITVGLVVGCIVAGATGYIDDSSIKAAPAITFLW